MLVLHDCIWKDWALICLKSLSGGNSLLPASMFTSPFATVYSRVNLAFFLLSSSVGHCSLWNIVSTNEVLCYLFVTNLADLLCIISSLFMSFCRWGSHTELAYSNVGLTNAVYAFSLMSLFTMFTFLLRNHMVMCAFWQMFCIWALHFRSDVIIWWLQGMLLMRCVLSYVHEDCS